MSNETELNNQGDYISGAVGDDGKEIVVGKNISTQRTEDNRRKEANQKNEQSTTFNFNAEPAFQLFLAIQAVQNGLSEFRSEQRQSIAIITEKLDNNDRRVSALRLEVNEQRKEIEELKERGKQRDEILNAIKLKVDAPPVIMATATSLTPLQFWLFLSIMVMVMVIVAVLGVYAMRGGG